MDSELRLIMCTSRAEDKSVPWLPTGKVAALLVMHLHFKMGHLNRQAVTGELLRSFWVLKPAAFVKKTLNCVTCRRFHGRTLNTPEGKLPSFRSTAAAPFEKCGIDHAGPLQIKGGSKCWILLFSCAVVRAIHIEVVDRLDVETTARAIQRFAARRGTPSFIISDNGTSFVALAKALKKTSLSWSTIVEAAPWWNGFTERMVGTVKRAAKKTCGRRALSKDELSTVMSQLEAAINRRPLMVDENGATITPAHFLFGATPPPLLQGPTHEPTASDPTEALNKLSRIRRQVSQDLWRRWTRDYLSSLRQWRRRPTNKDVSVKVGDVVLVEPPEGSHVGRDKWRLAVIQRLIEDSGGVSRAAFIRLGSRTTRRPLSKLVALEVDGCG